MLHILLGISPVKRVFDMSRVWSACNIPIDVGIDPTRTPVILTLTMSVLVHVQDGGHWSSGALFPVMEFITATCSLLVAAVATEKRKVTKISVVILLTGERFTRVFVTCTYEYVILALTNT